MMRATPFTHGGFTIVAEPLTDAPGPLRVVLLHGWGHTRHDMKPLAAQLASLGELWVVDAPGHGDAPIPSSPASPVTVAQTVNAWLATLPSMPTIVIGYSMGFRIALHLAAHTPSPVQALVAVAGAGIPRPLSLQKKARKLGIRFAMATAKGLKPYLGGHILTALRNRFGSEDYRAVSAVLRPTFLAMVNDDATPLCPHITIPTLLVYGGDDTATPPALGQKLAGLLPNASLQVLPHQTHASLLQGGRHLVARHILSFALPMAQNR